MGNYIVYYLPIEDYIGMTSNLSSRLSHHRSHKGRNTEGFEILHKSKTKLDARTVEQYYLSMWCCNGSGDMSYDHLKRCKRNMKKGAFKGLKHKESSKEKSKLSQPNRKRVLCVNEGFCRVFETIAEAANFFNIDRKSIRQHIVKQKTRGKLKGYKLSYCE